MFSYAYLFLLKCFCIQQKLFMLYLLLEATKPKNILYLLFLVGDIYVFFFAKSDVLNTALAKAAYSKNSHDLIYFFRGYILYVW